MSKLLLAYASLVTGVLVGIAVRGLAEAGGHEFVDELGDEDDGEAEQVEPDWRWRDLTYGFTAEEEAWPR